MSTPKKYDRHFIDLAFSKGLRHATSVYGVPYRAGLNALQRDRLIPAAEDHIAERTAAELDYTNMTARQISVLIGWGEHLVARACAKHGLKIRGYSKPEAQTSSEFDKTTCEYISKPWKLTPETRKQA